MGDGIIARFDIPDIPAAECFLFKPYERSIICLYSAKNGSMCISVNSFGVACKGAKWIGSVSTSISISFLHAKVEGIFFIANNKMKKASFFIGGKNEAWRYSN